MLCKYVDNNTVDICTSSRELAYLGLCFEPEEMSEDDIENLVEFLVENAAASAGYYPSETDDDVDFEILAATKENSDVVCFRVVGLSYEKGGIPKNYHIETFPGSDEGLENLSFDRMTNGAPVNKPENKEDEAFENLPEKVREMLKTPEGRELFKKVCAVREALDKNIPVDILYYLITDTLENAKAIMERIPDKVISESALYKCNKKYHLQLVLYEPPISFGKRIAMMLEYSEPILQSPWKKITLIKEHGECIIKDNVKNVLEKVLI